MSSVDRSDRSNRLVDRSFQERKKNDLPTKKGEEQGVSIKVTHFFGGDQIFTHVLGILRDFPYS